MSPLIEQALKTLNVRCNTTGLHPTDEDSIKSYLKALHNNGENIDSNELKQWVLSNGWQEKPAQQLCKWAETISNGGRVQIKHKAFVQTEEEIISHLKQMLNENS